MKEADRAKIEKHAAQKMELSICDIYDSPAIKTEIEKCYEKFNIQPNFFENKQVYLVFCIPPHPYKSKQAALDSINLDKLLDQTLKKWSNNYINYKAVIALKRYVIKNFKVSFCKPKYLDPAIWYNIAMARLFGIPKKRVLKCMHQILVDEYFPKVNMNLQIQINELTTEEDISYIWQEVEDKQKICSWNPKVYRRNPKDKYTNFYGRKKGKTEDPKRERDKTVYDFKKSNPKATLKNVNKKLIAKGFKTLEDYTHIYKIIERYKKHLTDIS
ncbi:MAG: hypothetical protein Q8Q46_00410 [Candidatus Giovannonibacteria bacterium]|nr:hypothetical protein [Candidatus Giovannonibacteria bacterium]